MKGEDWDKEKDMFAAFHPLSLKAKLSYFLYFIVGIVVGICCYMFAAHLPPIQNYCYGLTSGIVLAIGFYINVMEPMRVLGGHGYPDEIREKCSVMTAILNHDRLSITKEYAEEVASMIGYRLQDYLKQWHSFRKRGLFFVGFFLAIVFAV